MTFSARRTWFLAALVALAALLIESGLGGARADTAPADPELGVTVSGDILPTVQINGVVWSQIVIGNTVYAGGNFTEARPAGAAPGQQGVPRSMLLAYDIRTGELVQGFAPTFDGQVLSLASSPDRSRLYVGGQFVTVNGTTRSRVAAFDTRTGALINSFRPIVGSTVRAMAATDTALYVGGDFKTINGVSTPFFGAIRTSDGTTIAGFAPKADAKVTALTVNSSGSRVIAGGNFLSLGGAPAIGMGAVDPQTGAARRWDANKVIKNAGVAAGITGLAADADGVYGTGFEYSTGTPGAFQGNFEGVFRADGETGALVWLADCHGDQYSVWPGRGAVYSASHAHHCSNIVDGFTSTENPRTFHSGTVFSKGVAGTNGFDPLEEKASFEGQPSPALLHWDHVWSPGGVTGQDQAAWSVAGNQDYVVYGGEFTAINGTPQQGLVRFARAELAPNLRGPANLDELLPTASSSRAGEVALTWRETFDRDNRDLTYRIYRDFRSMLDRPVYVTTRPSQPWAMDEVTFIDRGLQPGSTVRYRLIVSDPFGNEVLKRDVGVRVAGGTDRPPATVPGQNSAPMPVLDSSVSQRSVSLRANDSYDVDGRIVTYRWDLGDGTSATGPAVSHTYRGYGNYLVRLTTTDDDGAVSHVVRKIHALPAGTVPTAAFTFSSSGLRVEFDSAASRDPDGSIVTRSWDFGDGATSDGAGRVTHTYSSPGTYPVRLRVTDNSGLVSESVLRLPVGASYAPMVPARLADTRTTKALPAGGVLRVKVAGTPGVPSNAAAAVLNVTVTRPEQGGYVTVYPCGSQPPLASNLNFSAGQTVPNAVVAGIGSNGEVCLKSIARTHLVVDVNGWFPAGTDYSPMVPARLADTRTTQSLPAGGVLRVKVAGTPGVPGDAAAAVLNVTVTRPERGGHVTVYPCGSQPPLASNLNFTAGQTVPNAVVAGIGSNGEVCLTSNAPIDLVVDVNGWFPAGADYSPMVPARLADTRTTRSLPAGGVLRVKVAGTPGVPGDAAAAVLNVTVTRPERGGYVTVYPCGSQPPLASNLNFTAGQTVPNAVVAGIGSNGEVCLTSSAPTHLVVDVNGWFPGT